MDLRFDPPPGMDVDAEWDALPFWVRQSIKLYLRCRLYKEIEKPDPGGVLDQDELTSNILQVIHNVYNEIISDKAEDAMRKIQSSSKNVMESINIGRSYSRKVR